MAWLQAFWLSVLQGITEFLPVSSSGHLILIPALFGWRDQGLPFDVAVHVGTLIAVLVYFRKDLTVILGDWLKSLAGRRQSVNSRLAWAIICATVMIGAAGIALESFVIESARNPVSVALATLFFGVVLGLADRFGSKTRSLETMNWKDVLVIGMAQILALVPGTSRSGVTISAGLMMGLSREAAARFSFLLAVPVIFLAGIWQARHIGAEPFYPHWQSQWHILLSAVAVSAIAAFICIHYFLCYVQRFSLMPFVIYRLILGVILLFVFM